MPTYNPICFIDRVDNLSFVERNGVIRSLTRKARVLFNTQPSPKQPTDFTVLSEALKATDMPVPYSTLANIGYDNLVLVERAPSLAENDPGVVDVVLKYEHILEGPNQSLYQPATGIIYGKGRSSVVEKTTNFYYPDGDPTNPKTQILVAHYFDPTKVTETGLAAQFVWAPKLPYTIIQGGEITIPFPQSNFKIMGFMDIDNPWVVVRQFIATMNAKPWVGYPLHTWLCSEVEFEVMDNKLLNPNATPRYKFGFEFQYNFDTWDPTVVFNDQRTGRPPANVEKADALDPTLNKGANPIPVLSYTTNPLTGNAQPAGQWRVPCLREVDFDEQFAAMFEQ